MTSDELIAAFDTIADAPDGVRRLRLRELVLQLAVRGKLVEQDPTDEPTSALLARALPSKKKHRTATMTQKEAEAPYVLPLGWQWTTAIALGDTSPRNNVADDTYAGFVPMAVVPKDYGATLRPESRTWADIKKGFTHIADGDIVVAKITPCFQNGKACVVSGLPNGVGAGTTELLVLRPHSVILDPFYALAFFKSPDFVRGGIETFTGTAGQQRVANDYFRSRPFPLPPFAEQERIVARVNEMMALLDHLEAAHAIRDTAGRAARNVALAALRAAEGAKALDAAWGRIAGQMDTLFAGPGDIGLLRREVLGLAVRGRLTGDDDSTWTRTTLGNILVEGPTNGWSPRAVEHPTGVMSLKLSATTRGYFDGSHFKYVEPEGDFDERLWLKADDLLIQRSNTPEYVGTAAVFDGPPRTYIYPDLMMRCRVSPEHDVRFVHLAISAPNIRAWFSAKASGTSKSMVKVNQATVASIPLRLPSHDRQVHIVAAVTRYFKLCDDLESRFATARGLHIQFAGSAVHHLDV